MKAIFDMGDGRVVEVPVDTSIGDFYKISHLPDGSVEVHIKAARAFTSYVNSQPPALVGR